MTEAINGKLNFSTQEIQNRLEQVALNENYIYEIDDQVTLHSEQIYHTTRQVTENSDYIAYNAKRIGELGNEMTNLQTKVENIYTKDEVYTKEEINSLIGICSLSNITYNNETNTENADGTITKSCSISSNITSDYRKMVDYEPILLCLKSDVISFTATVSNLHTESYKWNHPIAKEVDLVFNIEEGIFYITGSASLVDKVSSQDLPTAITFKYL